MEDILWGLVIGFSTGLIIGVVLAISITCCLMYQKICNVQVNGANLGAAMLDSITGQDSPSRTSGWSNMTQRLEGLKRKSVTSVTPLIFRIMKNLQRATLDFTTTIGKGAFGPVYRAHMANGETVDVKVLGTNSRQGEMEFLTGVLLLGRLHHKNLVNLVGYSADRGQHMLIYVCMSNGSVCLHLFDENREPMSWDSRVQIALDVARGLGYLHYGVWVFLRLCIVTLKSSNILLDHSMRARQVADFGLSREEIIIPHSSKVRGTVGYLDPDDVYSFGVLLFERISGRNPQQGLMEYVELAAIDTEGTGAWGERADTRLDGKFDVKELTDMAALAYKCIKPISRKWPSMRDVVQVLYWTCKLRHRSRNQRQNIPAIAKEPCFELDLSVSHDLL
ncbi:hypothetical protein ACOSQ4_012335 [Xanthoceras sorbifolium]